MDIDMSPGEHPTEAVWKAFIHEGARAAAAGDEAQYERLVALERLTNDIFTRGVINVPPASKMQELPEGRHSYPEVAFIGQVNSGKSSIIHSLAMPPKFKLKAERIGNKAGRTRILSFTNVADCFLAVDTPGLGYHKVHAHSRPHQKEGETTLSHALTLQYLALRKYANLQRVYWCIPANQAELTPVDHFIAAFLAKERIPFTVLLTRMDVALDPAKRYRSWKDIAYQARIPLSGTAALPGSVRDRERTLEEQTYGDITTRLRSLLDPLLERFSMPSAGLDTLQRNNHGGDGVDPVGDGDPPFPILGVSSKTRWNIDVLKRDIVHNVTQSLPTEELNVGRLKRISFAPATAAFQAAVERTYNMAFAEQVYYASVEATLADVEGEPLEYQPRAVLGMAPGGAISANSVERAVLEDAHRNSPRVSALLDASAGDRRAAAASALSGDSREALTAGASKKDEQDDSEKAPVADSLVTSNSDGDSGIGITAEEKRLHAAAYEALSAMRAVAHNGLTPPTPPPKNPSTRELTSFLQAELDFKANQRAQLTVREPQYHELSSATQEVAISRNQSEERFSTPLDGMWNAVLSEPAPFEDDLHPPPKPRGGTTRSFREKAKKYVDMKHRHEPRWTIDRAAYHSPFSNVDDTHRVLGGDHAVPDRSSGAGYRMDGLRQTGVLGAQYTPKKDVKVSHLSKWRRPVNNRPMR